MPLCLFHVCAHSCVFMPVEARDQELSTLCAEIRSLTRTWGSHSRLAWLTSLRNPLVFASRAGSQAGAAVGAGSQV